MILKSKPFQFTLWIFLIFLIILIGREISFIFNPLVVLVKTIFLPVLVAGILYYLTDSIVTRLTKWRIPRTIAILLIFLGFALVILFTTLFLAPVLQRQLTSLINNIPKFINQLDLWFLEFKESPIFAHVEQFEIIQTLKEVDYVKVVDGLISGISQNVVSFIGSVANTVIILFTIPFLLFFMLKDGKKVNPKIISYLPEEYQDDVSNVLRDINDTIKLYIQGILLVCLFIGTFVYIGYLIIGLDYALLLASVALVTNIIPYFGPVIGTVPGVIVGLIASPLTALKVVIMIVIIQQVEGQLIEPLVMGKKLKIHPVTIIVVLLTAGNLMGIVGMILAVPTFAVGRVVVIHVYRYIKQLRQAQMNVQD